MTLSESLRIMQEKAEAVQARVSRVSSFDEAIQYTLDVTFGSKGESIAVSGFDNKTVEQAKHQAKEAGLVFVDPPYREHADGIHTALTSADYGIAETGTLVIHSTSEDTRIATMLSEIHVAVLPVDRVRPDSISVEKEIRDTFGKNPAYLAFITGASRTADIERVLAIGVHGPQELHILLLEDTPS